MAKARRFAKEEIDNIILDYNNGNGLRPIELGEKYDRNPSSIINKLKDLHIYKNTRYYFTNDDVEYLKEHYPIDSWEELERRFPLSAREVIISKASDLGIKRESNDWTQEEINILIENYKLRNVKKLVELLPNRTYGAITAKAEKMGIKTRSLWTDEEISLMINNYGKVSVDEMVRLLPNRNRNSIILKAVELRLQSYDFIPWTKEEDKYISDNWKTTSDYLMSIYLNRTLKATINRRLTLGYLRVDVNNVHYENLAKYFRGQLQSWKNLSMKECDYQCVLTGSKDFQIHHKYNFRQIVEDFLLKYPQFKYDDFDKYTKEELKEMAELFIEEHNKHPFGVCVRTDLHNLFHVIYGKTNVPEQWDEFAENYKNGLYN